MRIFQEILKEANREEVIQAYWDRVRNETVSNEIYSIYTMGEIKKLYEEKFTQYLDRLLSLEPKPGKDEAILFAYEYLGMDDILSTPQIVLVHANEMHEKRPQTYAYEFCPQEEIISFFVAETPYTKKYIMDLIVDVLYEASFFGYNESIKEEEKQKLDEAVEEIKDPDYLDSAYSWEEFKIEHNIEDDEVDEVEKALRNEVLDDLHEYNDYTYSRELIEVQQIMRESGYNI